MHKAALLVAVLLFAACGQQANVAGNNAAPAGDTSTCTGAPEVEPGSPEELARKFMDATLAQDTEAAVACMRKIEREDKNGSYNLNKDGIMKSYTMGAAKISGENASVPVTVTFNTDKPEQTVELQLVREEGEWRINFWETLQQLMGSGKPD